MVEVDLTFVFTIRNVSHFVYRLGADHFGMFYPYYIKFNIMYRWLFLCNCWGVHPQSCQVHRPHFHLWASFISCRAHSPDLEPLCMRIWFQFSSIFHFPIIIVQKLRSDILFCHRHQCYPARVSRQGFGRRKQDRLFHPRTSQKVWNQTKHHT